MAIKEGEPKQEKKEEKVEKTEAPEWATSLGAKFDKMSEAFLKVAEGLSKQDEEEEEPKDEEKQEEEEEKPEDEEKQEEEDEEPKDEEKQEDEDEEPKEEEKVDIDAKIKDAVAKGIKKAFTEVAEKKSKVPKDVEDVLTYEKIGKMSWPEVNAYVKKRFNK